MGSSIMITEIYLALLLLQFSTAASILDVKPSRQSGSNGAGLKVEKRATSNNPGKAEAGRLIPGDVPIWTRTSDDRSNSGNLITAPARALQLSAGDTYAPSIMVTGSVGLPSLRLGQNCIISGDLFDARHCPIIQFISIVNHFDESKSIRTLHFSITVDDRFIDGQANMTVYFGHHIVNEMEHNISGYLYFEDSGCNPSISISPGSTVVATQCNCPMIGNSDPTQVTIAACQKLVATSTSGSMLSSLYLPGLVFILCCFLSLNW